jgi:uncharacterized membrane protein YkvA (DUF1232 family)
LDNQQQPQGKKDIWDKFGPLTTPLSLRGIPTWLIYLMGVLGLLYILNPGAGFIEFIPDNLPIVGNLDDGVAIMLLWAALVEFFEGRKYQKGK